MTPTTDATASAALTFQMRNKCLKYVVFSRCLKIPSAVWGQYQKRIKNKRGVTAQQQQQQPQTKASTSREQHSL